MNFVFVFVMLCGGAQMAFRDNSRLAVLNLGDTQLVEINAQKFEGIDSLEILWLVCNKLISVPLNAFMNLTKLREIALQQIEELPNLSK